MSGRTISIISASLFSGAVLCLLVLALPLWLAGLALANALVWVIYIAVRNSRDNPKRFAELERLEEIKAAGDGLESVVNREMQKSGHACKEFDEDCYLCFIDRVLARWRKIRNPRKP